MVGQLFDQDFVNFYVFGNANYDNRIPLQSSSITNQFGAWGYTVGGGVTLARRLHDGDLSLSYRGDYRDYFNSSYGSGTDQNLSLLYDKRLSRRWTVSIPVSAGILLYGSGGYSFATGAGSLVSPNSLSPETRFVQTGVNLTYQQTKRLSYVFGGTYFLNNYNYSAAIGSTGVSGSGSVMYRLTGRTTLGATYSHSYYHYTQNAGQTSIDSESLSLTHDFPGHWQVTASGGVNRSNTNGTISIPVAVLLNQQVVTGYTTGPYQRVSLTPSLQGSLTRFFRHSSVSISGGQGVIPGNGTYLTSRDQFLSGLFSYSTRRSNISAAGGYFHMTSIANSVSQSYSTENLSAAYGYTIARFISANVSYTFLHYGNLFGVAGLNDSRISLGLSFSTKSMPLGLF